MRVLELRAIEAAAPGARALDATAMIAELRMVKDDQELAAMRRAVAVVEAALGAAVAQIRAGMTEREILDDYPDLTEQDIRACLAYAADREQHTMIALTPHEAARLQTFPDFFSFDSVTSRTAWATMIGNAVPPLLATAIAAPDSDIVWAQDSQPSRFFSTNQANQFQTSEKDQSAPCGYAVYKAGSFL